MLYIIGLGLNVDGISKYGLEVLKKCKKVYLENYTVDFPYNESQLRDAFNGKKFVSVGREFVESLSIVGEAKKKDVALLVYGSPLTATTHMSLIQEAKASNIKYKVIYNASVFDAIAETGLQLYKFGKITSMPAWKKSYEPDSFMEVVKENQSIKAHSLILIDIGLDFQDALEQLKIAAKNHEFKLKNLVVCQVLGTMERKIFFKTIDQYKEYTGIKKPYCFIIPSKMHFAEREFIELFQ